MCLHSEDFSHSVRIFHGRGPIWQCLAGAGGGIRQHSRFMNREREVSEQNGTLETVRPPAIAPPHRGTPGGLPKWQPPSLPYWQDCHSDPNRPRHPAILAGWQVGSGAAVTRAGMASWCRAPLAPKRHPSCPTCQACNVARWQPNLLPCNALPRTLHPTPA